MTLFSLSRTVFEIFDSEVFQSFDLDLLTFRGHPGSKIFPSFESPYMTSYLTPIDTFSLSPTVFEIFDFKVIRVWPWPLTFSGHLGSKIFPPFESPYMTSYLTSIDTFSLSRTVFGDILTSKLLGFDLDLWPFEVTWGQFFFSLFESPYMTSYLISIDTFSLSRTVFEIFNFKVIRVWPWPLTFSGHLGSKIFSHFESPYMTSYLTFYWHFSLYLVPFWRYSTSKFLGFDLDLWPLVVIWGQKYFHLSKAHKWLPI